ncbi:MAG: orotate phosphoribosyltransferase [Actinobacteria bacterium 69-20]|jgi:orotate phosphoribosyltransferase|nr:orotate phosphoribosyltransferase [Actinomycetota bacterium]OJV29473.1 MAG: orotate phosphoribosyltransferase [Actinobacteria bacterium 69-20]
MSDLTSDPAAPPVDPAAPPVDAELKARLAELVKDLAVKRGTFTLASGRTASYYVDARVPTLHHEAGPLIGVLLQQLTADWRFDAVGGLTMGADPVALAMLHAPGRPLDAFVVRKAAKDHGTGKRIEGPSVSGRRVLAVEDTSTTGGSVLLAVDALVEAGATVVGVATVIDRDTGAAEAIRARGLPYRYLLGLADLGLTDDRV